MEVIYINSNSATYSVSLRVFKKILLQEFFQQVGSVQRRVEISERDVNDRELSQGVAQASNWFNDAKNNTEDIRISSFLRILSFLTDKDKIKQEKDKDKTYIPMSTDEIFTEQIIWIASIYIAIKDEIYPPDVSSLYDYLDENPERLRVMIPTIRGLKEKHKLSDEEQNYLEELLKYITT